MSSPWTDAELQVAVQSYLQMLKFEKDKTPYVKVEINRQLQGKIKREKGSIEKRFQNISSVLHAHGRPFVQGYVPLNNVGPVNEELIWKYLEILKDA